MVVNSGTRSVSSELINRSQVRMTRRADRLFQIAELLRAEAIDIPRPDFRRATCEFRLGAVLESDQHEQPRRV